MVRPTHGPKGSKTKKKSLFWAEKTKNPHIQVPGVCLPFSLYSCSMFVVLYLGKTTVNSKGKLSEEKLKYFVSSHFT